MTELTIFERLAAPFPPERISWRVGATNGEKTKGMALAYIDARDVMERLDEVVGPENWQARYPHANGKTVCELDIWIENRGWVTKADGAGDTDHEASKGALSDAFKRAAVRWGVGRYLYTIDSPWVPIVQKGRSSIIADDPKARSELAAALARAGDLLEWGTSAERATLKALAGVVRRCVQTTDDVRQFRQDNGGALGLLRVKAREHIDDLLERVSDAAQAKEAA